MSFRAQVCVRVGDLTLDVDLSGGHRPVAVAGPNGSGKTTLLRAIAGAVRPNSGRIEVNDRVVFDSEAGLDTPIEERRVGYVPQDYGLFPHLSVLDNVAFGLSTAGVRQPRAERRATAAKLLEALQGNHLLGREPRSLSGGERQRIALARALAVEPKLLLLDEPLAALDAGTRRQVRIYLRERLIQFRLPAVVVTHDARDAVALDAEVVVLERGRVVQRGSVSELKAAPQTAFVEEFAGLSEFTRVRSG